MAELQIDPFVSIEPEIEVDDETAAALQEGMKAADEGRWTTLDEARERMQQWLSKSSSPIQH